jgi:hypothetical protein
VTVCDVVVVVWLSVPSALAEVVLVESTSLPLLSSVRCDSVDDVPGGGGIGIAGAITGGLNAVGAVTVVLCVVVVCASVPVVNNTNAVALSIAVLIMRLALLFPCRPNFQAPGIFCHCRVNRP